MQLAGIGGLGPPELLIILAIVVVLFGATRLTDIGKNLGRGIREFRKEVKTDETEPGEEEKEPAGTAGEDNKS
jgi:sec-independent protein translocase protein TatA